MQMSKIKRDVETALATVDPVDVKVEQDEEALYVLVVSDKFSKMSMARRVTQCIELLFDHAETVSMHFDLKVEPVTPREFRDRLIPWPE